MQYNYLVYKNTTYLAKNNLALPRITLSRITTPFLGKLSCSGKWYLAQDDISLLRIIMSFPNKITLSRIIYYFAQDKITLHRIFLRIILPSRWPLHTPIKISTTQIFFQNLTHKGHLWSKIVHTVSSRCQERLDLRQKFGITSHWTPASHVTINWGKIFRCKNNKYVFMAMYV